MDKKLAFRCCIEGRKNLVVVFYDTTGEEVVWLVPTTHKYFDAVKALVDDGDNEAIIGMYNLERGLVTNKKSKAAKKMETTNIVFAAALYDYLSYENGTLPDYLKAFADRLVKAKKLSNREIKNLCKAVRTETEVDNQGCLQLYRVHGYKQYEVGKGTDGCQSFFDFAPASKLFAKEGSKGNASLNIFSVKPEAIIRVDMKDEKFVAVVATDWEFVRCLKEIHAEPEKSKTKPNVKIGLKKAKESKISKLTRVKKISVRPPGVAKIDKKHVPARTFDLTINSYRNRVGINKMMLQSIQARPGDTVYCEYTKKKIVISKEKKDTKFVYTVSKEGNIKVGYGLICASGLNNESMEAVIVRGVIVVKAKK